jgi:hypothetical protein
MICFYKKHYVYVGYIISECSWFICDDESIKKIGHWEKLKDYLVNKKWFPSLIFYEEYYEIIKEKGIYL